MISRRKNSITVFVARAAALALALSLLVPHVAQAGSGSSGSAPQGLSAVDWAAILGHIERTDPDTSLFTSQVAKLTGAVTVANDQLGRAVAVSNDIVVVGVPEDDDPVYGGDAGSVYVFERNQGGADAWDQFDQLTAGAGAGDRFGTSVGISGDTIVVSAPYDDDCGNESGAAYVFERNKNGANQWGQVAKLTAGVPSALDRFGSAVAISGDTIVVGVPYANGGAHDSGVAYVFARNQGGADNWEEVEKLTVSDPEAGDWLGSAVAISGDTVVAGAPRDDDACPLNPDCNSGSAYVFERNEDGAEAWGQVTKLAAADAAEGDRFGDSVAIDVDTAVVGAYQADGGEHSWELDYGAAYVFERNEDGAEAWGQVVELTASDAGWGDYFGRSVAISEDAIAVSAHGRDGYTGAVYVFERNLGGAEAWGEAEIVVADDTAEGDRFGIAVAMSGNNIAAGAPYNDEAGEWSGAAYVFARRGGAWVQKRNPFVCALEGGDMLGFAVAVSGDTAVVGAHMDHHGGHADAGAAYVFQRNWYDTAEAWGQVAVLTASDAADGDYFGKSVAISGDTIVVGAPSDDDAGNASGSAYVFERNRGGAAESWDQVKKLTAGDAAAGDEFGVSVAVSGDTIVVGAWRDSSNAGSAYVFERNYDPGDPSTPLAENWGQVKKLTAGDAAASDRFGRAVAITGDTAVVGAYYKDAGAAYVFERNKNGANLWGQVKKLTGSDPGVMDWFGHAVGISGDTVVVGAPFYDSWAGAAYVFERNEGGQDQWGEVEKLTANDGADNDSLGWSVAISGDTVVAGAYWDDDDGDASGSAYVFERNRGGEDAWGQFAKLTPADGAEGDYFGHGVSISGNTVVVGSPYDDDAGSASGAAYVFRLEVARVRLPLVLRSSS